MSGPRAALLLLAALLVACSPAAGKEIVVGGNGEWVVVRGGSGGAALAPSARTPPADPLAACRPACRRPLFHAAGWTIMQYDTINAAVGDVVTFNYVPGAHDVVGLPSGTCDDLSSPSAIPLGKRVGGGGGGWAGSALACHIKSPRRGGGQDAHLACHIESPACAHTPSPPPPPPCSQATPTRACSSSRWTPPERATLLAV